MREINVGTRQTMIRNRNRFMVGRRAFLASGSDTARRPLPQPLPCEGRGPGGGVAFEAGRRSLILLFALARSLGLLRLLGADVANDAALEHAQPCVVIHL